MVVEPLVEVEAVEVVGHLAVVECLFAHCPWGARGVHLRREFSGGRVDIGDGVVAVDNLVGVARVITCGCAKHGADALVHRRGGALRPAVLDVAVARVGNTCRGERTGDSEVVDLSAEVAEE